MNLDGCFLHNSDDWKTPSDMFDYFMKLGYKDLFPYKADFNQFNVFYDNDKLFINPPYSQLKRVASYVRVLYYRHNEILLLIPARTDTRYFHELLELGPVVYFIPGRLHFNDSVNSAPFPSILLFFSEHNIMPTYSVFKLR